MGFIKSYYPSAVGFGGAAVTYLTPNEAAALVLAALTICYTGRRWWIMERNQRNARALAGRMKYPAPPPCPNTPHCPNNPNNEP